MRSWQLRLEPHLQCFAATLAALWAGIMIGVGYVFAPVLFKLMPSTRHFAGSIAGEAFTVTAYISLAAGVIIMVIVRHLNSRAGFSTPNTPLIMVLGALFLAIMGQFVILPEVVQARDVGGTTLSFATLHGISSAIYLLQIVCLLVLNWSLYKPLKKPDNIDSAVKSIADEE